jgi:hypothetical protein
VAQSSRGKVESARKCRIHRRFLTVWQYFWTVNVYVSHGTDFYTQKCLKNEQVKHICGKKSEISSIKLFFGDSRHKLCQGVWQYTPSTAKRPGYKKNQRLCAGNPVFFSSIV